MRAGSRREEAASSEEISVDVGECRAEWLCNTLACRHADCRIDRIQAGSSSGLLLPLGGGLVLLEQFDRNVLAQPDRRTDHAIGLHVRQVVRPLRDSAARHVERASEIGMRCAENPCRLVFGHVA